MISEKVAALFGVVAVASGGVAFVRDLWVRAVHVVHVTPLFGDVGPNDVSAWVLTVTSGITAIGGAWILFRSNMAASRREERAKDEKQFAASKDGKIAELSKTIDQLKLQLETARGENKLLGSELEFIKSQNRDQIQKIDDMAGDVKAIGSHVGVDAKSAS